jgi:hypothetical protein
MGDNYLSAKLMLPKGGVMVKGRLTAQKQDWNGNPVGLANDNPILDTQSYIVDFDNGDQTEVTANMIAESLFLKCDPGGNQYVLLKEIVDHWCLLSAVKLTDQKIVRANGKTYLKHTTVAWQLCCQGKEGSTSWENLADLKESHPIETAGYANILGIDNEPALNWWVPNVLRKMGCIISLVQKRNPCYLKRTHKSGIEVPETAKEALELNKKNGNTF